MPWGQPETLLHTNLADHRWLGCTPESHGYGYGLGGPTSNPAWRTIGVMCTVLFAPSFRRPPFFLVFSGENSRKGGW